MKVLFHEATKVPTPLLLWKSHALKLVMVGLVKTELQMETSLWHTYTLTEIWAMIMVDYYDVWFIIDDIMIIYTKISETYLLVTILSAYRQRHTHTQTHIQAIRMCAVT